MNVKYFQKLIIARNFGRAKNNTSWERKQGLNSESQNVFMHTTNSSHCATRFFGKFRWSFTIFPRSLKSSHTMGLFSCAYYWLKYNFRSFPQSVDDAKHVRIDLMNIIFLFFLKKKFSSKFLTQIWPFPRSQYEKISPLANFECQKKKMLRHFMKNPLPQFCRAWSGAQIKYPQHGHISWIEGYKKSKVKKVKNTLLSALLK